MSSAAKQSTMTTLLLLWLQHGPMTTSSLMEPLHLPTDLQKPPFCFPPSGVERNTRAQGRGPRGVMSLWTQAKNALRNDSSADTRKPLRRCRKPPPCETSGERREGKSEGGKVREREREGFLKNVQQFLPDLTSDPFLGSTTHLFMAFVRRAEL